MDSVIRRTVHAPLHTRYKEWLVSALCRLLNSCSVPPPEEDELMAHAERPLSFFSTVPRHCRAGGWRGFVLEHSPYRSAEATQFIKTTAGSFFCVTTSTNKDCHESVLHVNYKSFVIRDDQFRSTCFFFLSSFPWSAPCAYVVDYVSHALLFAISDSVL